MDELKHFLQIFSWKVLAASFMLGDQLPLDTLENLCKGLQDFHYHLLSILEKSSSFQEDLLSLAIYLQMVYLNT